jgi:hypothetical protein
MRALVGVEPEGSCFHQSLFTAYQTVLCCEVCSGETQEQIVSNLSNFIENSPQQIGSGWKPLFGALKAIRISPAKQRGNNTKCIGNIKESLLVLSKEIVLGFSRELASLIFQIK